MFNYSSVLLFQLLLSVISTLIRHFHVILLLVCPFSIYPVAFSNFFFSPRFSPESAKGQMLILAHHHGYDPLLTRGLLWIINPGRPYKPNCFMEKECQLCLGHGAAQILPDVLFLECRAHHFSPQ